MSPIDALYEAAKKATPGPWRVPVGSPTVIVHDNKGIADLVADARLSWHPVVEAGYIALADPQTIMALVEAYLVAKHYVKVADGHMPGDPVDGLLVESQRRFDVLRAAIEKVEALGT